MNHGAHQTLYDILGIPCGVGVDHIKDSYRLLTKKTPLTDGAYAVLSDPVKNSDMMPSYGQRLESSEDQSLYGMKATPLSLPNKNGY
jgi:DnaJ-class molecular chaperone